jgi:hypothetical protein
MLMLTQTLMLTHDARRDVMLRRCTAIALLAAGCRAPPTSPAPSPATITDVTNRGGQAWLLIRPRAL